MDDDELDLPDPDPDERRLNIQMPAELISGTYANFANVSFSPYEFTLTFARIERRGRGRRRARRGGRER